MNPALWLLTALLCCLVCSGAALAEEPPARTTETEQSAAPALVDLNRADVAELTTLPGIGQKRAEAILAFRESHGGFQNVAQLLKIKGIGRAMLRKLRTLVTLSPMAADGPDVALARNGQRQGGTSAAHRVR
jgi:competence protein ComEA